MLVDTYMRAKRSMSAATRPRLPFEIGEGLPLELLDRVETLGVLAHEPSVDPPSANSTFMTA